eukprot:10650286-Alexandrium_andersonii.AAC.1
MSASLVGSEMCIRDRGDTAWTSVDPTRRVQVVNLRDAKVAPKAANGIRYTAFPEMSILEKARAVRQSSAMVARLSGDPAVAPETNTSSRRARRLGVRSR